MGCRIPPQTPDLNPAGPSQPHTQPRTNFRTAANDREGRWFKNLEFQMFIMIFRAEANAGKGRNGGPRPTKMSTTSTL